MNYATVCSGAEAFGPAWHALGLRPVFHAEIEAHASAVLRYQYPTVPNYGDFTQIATPDGPQPTRPVQLLCGGTPCQTYSVAGLRQGLDSYKGGLTLEFVRLARRLDAQWLLWENVPGVLSSDGGRAFGTFLGTLAECGYGFAYRVLDLQHFGCPQRRKRVFLVAHSGGDWQSCAQVLFESESLRGNPAPSRQAGQDVTGTPSRRAGGGGGIGTPTAYNVAFCDANGSRPDRPNGGMYVQQIDRHKTLTAGVPVETLLVETVTEYAGNAEGSAGLPFLTVSNIGKMVNNQTPLLTVTACFKQGAGAGAGSIGYQENIAPTLTGASSGTQQSPALLHQSAVRRLVPIETERLMGWADDWTRYGINVKGLTYELADGPRYRICGNGWGEPPVSWLAARILQVEALNQAKA